MEVKKITLILFMIMVGALSFTKVARWASNPQTHSHSIETIEQKTDTALILAGSTTAASGVLSLLPDDTCTPIATELAEMTKYFLVVLGSLYLEKYLLTITGIVSFKILIPLACILVILGIMLSKSVFENLGCKLMICAVSLFLIIPVTVKLSDMIYETKAESISETIDEAEIFTSIETDDEGNFLDKIGSIAITVMDYASSFMNKTVESLAVMLITTCVFPVLVMLFFFYLVKSVLSSTGIDVARIDMSRIESAIRERVNQ